jgi:hypothetical protein
MSKQKQTSQSDERARAQEGESKGGPGHDSEDECCALLRRYPDSRPASKPRRRRTHESREDERT